MPDLSDAQNLDATAPRQPLSNSPYQFSPQEDHLYAAGNQADLQPGQEIAATISSFPASMPMNTEVSLRQQPPLVQRPPYNPSIARLDVASAVVMQPVPQRAVPVQSPPVKSTREMQTIEIAPHPTTNRFPWAPVDNPTVPVPDGPTPYTGPVYEAPQLSQVASEQLAVELLPPEPILTEPVAPPPIEAPPITATIPPAPLVPFNDTIKQELPILEPVPTPAIIAAPVAPPQIPPKQLRRVGKSVHIYGESAKEAWHVFKPSKITRIFATILVLISVVAAFIFWQSIGAPTNPMDVPFLKPLVNAR